MGVFLICQNEERAYKMLKEKMQHACSAFFCVIIPAELKTPELFRKVVELSL